MTSPANNSVANLQTSSKTRSQTATNVAENKALIETFYQAFQNKDYLTMAQCYHPQAHFKDEAFDLRGAEIAAMWHMLLSRSNDLALTFSVKEDAGQVTAHWEPKYTFSQSGRFVHNIIDAEFEFKDGKIYRHRDYFDFWRWSRQAIGVPAYLLGWTGFFRNKVSTMANITLQSFITKHPEYQQ